MSELSKKTAKDLIDDVASLVDIQLTDNTTPSRDQVVQWLNQGVIEVFRLIPIEELRDTMEYFQHYGVSFLSSALPTNLLRMNSFKRNGVPCVKLEENEFDSLLKSNPYKYTADNPAYSRNTFVGDTQYKVFPGGNVLFQVSYVPYPFVYNTIDEEEVPGSNAIPAVLEFFVTTFAAIYVRVQDEEPGQFQLYMADWRQNLQMAYGVPVDTTEGG